MSATLVFNRRAIFFRVVRVREPGGYASALGSKLSWVIRRPFGAINSLSGVWPRELGSRSSSCMDTNRPNPPSPHGC